MGGWGFVLQSTVSFILTVNSTPRSERPVVVDAPIMDVSVPLNVTDNEVSQITVEGVLPSTCYELGNSFVRTRNEDLDQGIIQFHIEALRYDRPCMDIKTPYTRTIDIGVLPAGTYSILQLKNLKKRASLVVSKSENTQVKLTRR